MIHLGISKVHDILKFCLTEVGSAEVGSPEVGSAEVGSAEVDFAEGGS